MDSKKKTKKPNGQVVGNDRFHGHLIRIPDTTARRAAIVALGEVREAYCGFTDFQYLVGDSHLEALKRLDIPFEILA